MTRLDARSAARESGCSHPERPAEWRGGLPVHTSGGGFLRGDVFCGGCRSPLGVGAGGGGGLLLPAAGGGGFRVGGGLLGGGVFSLALCGGDFFFFLSGGPFLGEGASDKNYHTR